MIKPSVLVRADQTSVQTDIALMTEMSGSVFGGIGLRGYDSSSFDALVFTAGLTINDNYRLIYSFDTGLSNIKRVNQGTHELTLNYNLRKVIGAGLNPPVIYNPRNL
jgi:glutamine cyclotransferase